MNLPQNASAEIEAECLERQEAARKAVEEALQEEIRTGNAPEKKDEKKDAKEDKQLDVRVPNMRLSDGGGASVGCLSHIE